MLIIPVPIPPFEEIEKLYALRIAGYEKALLALEREIRAHLAEAGLKASIKHRVKSLRSLYEKLYRRLPSLPESTTRIIPTDLMGLRVVCPFLSDIEGAKKIIETRYTVTSRERKGADLGFKEFGYESLHMLIECPGEIRTDCSLDAESVVEIQVRTLLQDAWAEVEHELIYKAEFSPLDKPMQRRLAALNANLTLSDVMFQEIRDYQKTLHDQLHRRRHDFWNKVNADDSSPFNSRRERDDPDAGGLPNQNIDQMLLEALLAHNEGDHNRAVAIYSEILASETRRDLRSIIFVHRGMAYFSQDRLDSAAADFSRAVAADPACSRGYLYRGLIKVLRNEDGAALEDFAAALERDPYSQDALLERAKLYYRHGENELCRSDCRQILNIDPSHTKALELREQLDQG